MRSSWLIALVVGLHVLAIGGITFMQGCETRRPTVEPTPPPAPVMPPRAEPDVLPPPKPVFQPPRPIEPAPKTIEAGAGGVVEVQPGDSLSKIAARHGVSTRELAELNKIKDANHIRAGQKLVLPVHARSSGDAAAKPKKTAKTAAEAGQYVVQAGDALEKIARRHGVTVAALKETNNLKSDKIVVGQKLSIPGAAKAEAKEGEQEKDKEKPKTREKTKDKAAEAAAVAEPAAPPPAAAPAPTLVEPRLEGDSPPMEYTVMEGDTVEEIARMYIIRKEDLLRANNLTEGQALRTGQKIKIPTSGM